jgi:DNA-binding HxlR family transcriptional regulator
LQGFAEISQVKRLVQIDRTSMGDDPWLYKYAVFCYILTKRELLENQQEKAMTKPLYGCAIEQLTGAIGGKYKAVILYHLMQGTKRFNELGRLIPDASQRMLTQHLRELEDDGLVHREVYREVPPRVEYSLTELGHSLAPLLEQMQEWAKQHMTKEGAPSSIPK